MKHLSHCSLNAVMWYEARWKSVQKAADIKKNTELNQNNFLNNVFIKNNANSSHLLRDRKSGSNRVRGLVNLSTVVNKDSGYGGC